MPVVSDNRPVESDNMPVESDNMPVESDNMPVDSDNMPVQFIVVAKQVSIFFMSLITRIFWLEALLAWPLSVTLHFNWHDRPKCPCCVFVFITIFNSQKYNNYCMK